MEVLFSVDSFGSILAEELNWGNADHIRAVEPPFDYIIGTDVVSCHASLPYLLWVFSFVFCCVEHDLRKIPSLGLCRAPLRTSVADNSFIVWSQNHYLGTSPKLFSSFKCSCKIDKTGLQLGYELRSTNVHDQMLDLWKRNFEVKTVPKAKVCTYIILQSHRLSP